MAKMLKKSFDSPEETRPMKKGKAEVVDLGGVTAMRVTFEPGWRWSECVKPIVGTQSCQVAHLVGGAAGCVQQRRHRGPVRPAHHRVDGRALPSGLRRQRSRRVAVDEARDPGHAPVRWWSHRE